MNTQANIAVLHDYISRPDLAAQLGVGVRTLVRWETLREGPAVTKIGKRPYYNLDAVKDWLKSREKPTPRSGRKRAA